MQGLPDFTVDMGETLIDVGLSSLFILLTNTVDRVTLLSMQGLLTFPPGVVGVFVSCYGCEQHAQLFRPTLQDCRTCNITPNTDIWRVVANSERH